MNMIFKALAAFVISLTLVLSFLACSEAHLDPVEILKLKAEKGDVETQLELGILYYEGKNVPLNFFESGKWFLRAGEQGDSIAQYYLGEIFYHGKGVQRDFSESAKWYLKSAQSGDVDAQIQIGHMYYSGKGFKRDYSEALKWFRAAAIQGNPEAQLFTGIFYYTGEGTPPDYAEAEKWFRLAATNGEEIGQIQLGQLLLLGKGVEKNAKEALDWFHKAAAKGNPEAMYHIGLIHYHGAGVEKNFKEALLWFKKGAEQKHTDSMIKLGAMYTLGQGVSQDIEKGAELVVAGTVEQSIKEMRLSRETNDQDSKSRNKLKSIGTGVIITDDGVILTAGHLVKGSKQISISATSGAYSAHVIKVDDVNDLALLQCNGKFRSASIKSSASANIGMQVYTIGFPNPSFQGFDPKFTRGEISSVSGYKDDPRLWQISVPVQPGNSGGPLFDEDGNLIGLVLSKIDALGAAKATGDIPQNVNYAIKSAYFLPLVEPFRLKLAPERKPFFQTNNLANIIEKTRESVVMVSTY